MLFGEEEIASLGVGIPAVVVIAIVAAVFEIRIAFVLIVVEHPGALRASARAAASARDITKARVAREIAVCGAAAKGPLAAAAETLERFRCRPAARRPAIAERMPFISSEPPIMPAAAAAAVPRNEPPPPPGGCIGAPAWYPGGYPCCCG